MKKIIFTMMLGMFSLGFIFPVGATEPSILDCNVWEPCQDNSGGGGGVSGVSLKFYDPVSGSYYWTTRIYWEPGVDWESRFIYNGCSITYEDGFNELMEDFSPFLCENLRKTWFP